MYDIMSGRVESWLYDSLPAKCDKQLHAIQQQPHTQK